LESAVRPDPIEQFGIWLEEAKAARILEYSAMCLSTVDANRQPHSRMVLLRGYQSGKFAFFTNYLSAKARDLELNSRACLNFWWGQLERQIRIEGTVQKAPAEVSDRYWASRPHDSQVASYSSPQSSSIEIDQLTEMVTKTAREFPDTVPRPEHWGGYYLVPESIEFWQGGKARLHDRLLYTKSENGWQITRLAP
jgi:pyridoxamine 5'-phosphate oxidase